MVLTSLLQYQFDCNRLSECFKIVPVLVKYTMTRICEFDENLKIIVVFSF